MTPMPPRMKTRRHGTLAGKGSRRRTAMTLIINTLAPQICRASVAEKASQLWRMRSRIGKKAPQDKTMSKRPRLARTRSLGEGIWSGKSLGSDAG